MLALGGIGQAAQMGQEARAAKDVDLLESFQQEVQTDARRELNAILQEFSGETEPDYQRQPSALATHLDKTQRLAQQLESDNARLLEIGNATLRMLEGPTQRYADALENFMDAGAVNPITLPNAATIEHRLRKLDTLGDAVAEVAETTHNLEADVTRRLAAAGLEGEQVEGFLKGWRQGANLELTTKIRDCDRRIVAAARGQLETLRDGLGAWQVDRYGQIMFGDDQVLRSYNAHVDAMNRAAKQQEFYRRLLAQRMSQKRPTTF